MSSEPHENADGANTGTKDGSDTKDAQEEAREESENTASEGAKGDMQEVAQNGEQKRVTVDAEGVAELLEGIARVTEQESTVEGAIMQVISTMEGATSAQDHAGEMGETAAGIVVEEAMDEIDLEEDVEHCQESSGSEDEELQKARKDVLSRMQHVMTKPSDIQNPNRPRITKDAEKEYMDEHIRAVRDKAILQSMAVAERGYITRLRPPSAPTDKLTLSQYQIRPGLEEKFKSVVVKEMIHTVLNDELGGKTYSEEEAKEWSQSIANTIRMKVKEMGFPRYKFVVQCVIGEEHGAGVKIGSRCLWDADTDNYASDTFLNETIFCMTAVYAIYFY